MRGRNVQKDSSTCGEIKRLRSGLWAACVVAVVVAIAGVSSEATASTQLGGAVAQKSKSSVHQPALGYPGGFWLERQSGGLRLPSFLTWAAGGRRFTAEKVVICHSTSSDTNPYNRIISAGTAGHDPSQGTHDLDLFGPPGDDTFQCPGLVGITKVCTGGVTGSFTLHITNTYNAADATRTIACTDRIRFPVLRGTVTISEDVPANAVATFSGDCTQDSANSGHTSIGASTDDPDIGESKECSITNSPTPPTMAVSKSCPTGSDASGDLVNVVIHGTPTATNLACEGSHTFTVSPGAISVTEAAAGTTTLANYTQSSSGCTATLAQGGAGSCTLTNTLKAKQELKVVKSCPSGSDAAGDRFNVLINGTPTAVDLACEGNHVFSDLTGTVTVTEAAAGTTTLSNYTQSSSGCTSVALVRGGSQVTCTITNTLKALPTVVVTKACVPSAGADADDRFQVTNNDVSVGDPFVCGATRTVTLDPGAAFDLDEIAGNGTTDLLNYTESRSDGCTDSEGLQRGDIATCTITNTLKAAPKVTVTKACPNGKANAGDHFQVKRNGTNVGAALDCGAETNDHIDVTVTAGTAYAITEGGTGTADLANYVTSFGEGCSGTLEHFGDTATCTITNTLKAAPKLTVIKHVVNDNGGTQSAGNFTLTVTGSSPSPASFAGSEAGTTVTLQPGPYAVNEAAVSGYSTTKSAGCAGSLGHFGDTATCTVTNDDIAAPPPPPPPGGAPEIDLAITKADSPDPVSVGALLTYTLTVTNKKGDTANNVVVTDSLPSAVTFVSVSSTKGSCSGTNPITCNIGTVAFNELVSIMIVVRPSNPGTITNTAIVTGREHEHDPSNNTATATTLVQGAFVPPSVCYALTVTPRTLTVGRTTIVRVRVREAGKPVKGVRVVVTGRGVTKRANTNAGGVARFVIMGRSPGILQIRVPSHATCRTQRIGVLGVFTPPVTG